MADYNIYLVTQDRYLGYDAYHGHVIVATSESEAIELAQERPGDEERSSWYSAKVENVGKYTLKTDKPFILLSDYNAG